MEGLVIIPHTFTYDVQGNKAAKSDLRDENLKTTIEGFKS